MRRHHLRRSSDWLKAQSAAARGASPVGLLSVFVGIVLTACASSGPSSSRVAQTPTAVTSPVGTAPSPSAPGPAPSPSATISPVSGPSPVEFLWSATGGASGMNFPGAMAIDPDGRLWVADTGNSRFAIFEPDGTFVEYWEHRGTGVGEFILQTPCCQRGAVAFAPDGSFYVLDVGNRRVEHFDDQRTFIGSWGSFGNEPGHYEDQQGIAVDTAGVVYVEDGLRGVVEWYDKDGNVLGSFVVPVNSGGVTIDAQGSLYVTTGQPEVEKFDAAGTLLATVGSAATGPGQFTNLSGALAIDAAGRLFVSRGPNEEETRDQVLVLGADGTFLASFGSPGDGDGQLRFAYGILLDGKGNIYVADAWGRVEKFRLLPPFNAAGTASPSP
jgi:tripartite motif-containing protein 71